ncbi:MAG: FAD-dependent oxidoreductase [Gaiellales bacterium]|nr:FAD-dependent oxidoreductase [Gaiellales bacterium]
MAPRYDLIVVGAGPGGTAAAKAAAERKLKVLLLERGRRPGDKQMSGSYLFRTITEEIFPGFEQADFHKGQIRLGGVDFRWMLDNDEKRHGISVAPGADVMRNWMTVYRNETDEWFAEQAVRAGAELKTALVTDLLWENEGTESARVRGVVTAAGDFEAPATIDASGLNSLIAERAGLAKWGVDKVMLGLKYIYRVDGEVLRQRLQTYMDSDGVEVDWGATQMLCGSNPDHFGAHATGMPGRGIVSICFYSALKEMVEARVNIHQRAQWYLTQPTCRRLIEGGEFIYCDFHALAAGDMVGYVPKSYLPGLLLVGDAGGFSQPVDNFGANVALWMGRMAGELCADMKTRNDYSEAMFARYEENWRNSWVGEDNVPEISVFMRDGSLNQVFKTMDDVVSYAFACKWENTSYPSIILGIVPKILPVLPALMEAPHLAKRAAEVGLKKASPLMQLLGMWPGTAPNAPKPKGE